MTYLQKTMQLISDSEITPPQLAKETGLGKRWMYKLYKGEYADPSVNKIELIYNYLVAEQNKAA